MAFAANRLSIRLNGAQTDQGHKGRDKSKRFHGSTPSESERPDTISDS
jgi:hypothetical protein